MGTVIGILLTTIFVFSLAALMRAQTYLQEVRLVRKDINEFRRSLIKIVQNNNKRRF